MATIEELKRTIDLHDLAQRLGLERPGSGGNYRSPHHDDRSPSLSIQADKGRWKDWSADGAGGSCVDLVAYVEGLETTAEAVRRLHELYGLERERHQGPTRPQTQIEWIADQCVRQADQAMEYLTGRGIPESVVQRAIKARALGWNSWTSSKVQPGEFGYGGPGAAFIVRSLNPGHVRGIDMRYVDPDLNGGVKTKTKGDKANYPWFVDGYRLERAQTVYVVESAVNALSVEAAEMPYTAALATRGTGTVESIDWRVLRGKRVVLCMDDDAPDKFGRRAGPEAAWKIYDRLASLDVAAMLVDQSEWAKGWNDINDVLAETRDPAVVRSVLRTLEPWAIQGLPGQDPPPGRKRVFLPSHDFSVYWRFRVKEDFTSYVKKWDQDDEGGGTSIEFEDVAAFRVAAIGRVRIASATSVMSGEPDVQPTTVFSVAVQQARHGPKLIRAVFGDEQVHNPERWQKFGAIFARARFFRLLNILERTADTSGQDAVNFVGLCWQHGRPHVNEGEDCFFTEPEKQCPYHNLSFPRGETQDAARVVRAYQSTMHDNAATMLLAWALGGHLKTFVGYWPHMQMQADKGAGKSTLIKRLERSIAMTMFGGQSLQTEFRLLTSVSHTSHPIGWEEISQRRQDVIDRAVQMLQETYQYTVTRRGSEMTEFLMCAPVLLAGEDVPVRSLTGKLVRCELTGRKGTPLPEDLPRFPVRQWLDWLASLDPRRVRERLAEWHRYAQDHCRSTAQDEGASRMAGNYAAVMLAWSLLAEFAGLPQEQGAFIDDVVGEMNSHIGETKHDREPWVWLMELAISEIVAGEFRHPYQLSDVDGVPCIVCRPSWIVDHISSSNRLRAKWDAMPVKTARVFRRQLDQAGVILRSDVDRVIRGKRHGHLCALSMDVLSRYGLHCPQDADDGYLPAAGGEFG